MWSQTRVILQLIDSYFLVYRVILKYKIIVYI